MPLQVLLLFANSFTLFRSFTFRPWPPRYLLMRPSQVSFGLPLGLLLISLFHFSTVSCHKDPKFRLFLAILCLVFTTVVSFEKFPSVSFIFCFQIFLKFSGIFPILIRISGRSKRLNSGPVCLFGLVLFTD